MTWTVTAVVVLALIGAIATYARWFVKQASASLPCCRVHLAAEGDPSATTAEVTLVGTSRKFRLTRLTCASPVQAFGHLEIEGFIPETDHGLGDGVRSWRPKSPIKVAPDTPLTLRFSCRPPTAQTIRVTGWLETRMGAGGSATVFHVLVGPLAPGQRELRNLESRVRSESVQQGIKPIEHPEWGEVLRLRQNLDQAPDR